ncbi:MAG: hypothetical protein ABEH59_07830 [Halobacteriales archaeon]
MVNDLVVGIGLVGIVVLAVSVLGTVTRRERLLFVPGVLAVILGMTFLSGLGAGAVVVLGLVAVLGSTVPMLRTATA